MHLLVADLLWIAFILFGASILATHATAQVRDRVRGSVTVKDLPLHS